MRLIDADELRKDDETNLIYPGMQSMEIVFDKDCSDYERPPEEIKRDIKHERNPMRLKQLQKELNSSYLYWRKRNGEK